ncbi:NTP transferase domain-containing protein [Oryzobacter sp. R7]|uniref:NTP transferase domain-containing protein n=1 Tax=Oryzobacter faecalis TaxID=3388656 RepID=UPI00398D4B12
MTEPPAPSPTDVTAVVLAGGTSRRFGSDKLAAPLRGSTVLGETLGGLAPEWAVVAVGPARPTDRWVTWTVEDPPGGGPLAGLAAGLALVTTTLVVVLAGDVPDGGPAAVELVEALRGGPAEVDAVVATDPDGVPNPLLGAYRVAAVRAVLPDTAHGRPARLLLDLRHTEIRVASGISDVDTPADLARLGGSRARRGGRGTPT